MLTWGRRDGDPQNSVLYGDFLLMQERLNEGYLAYASLAETLDNPIYVAPVGPVFAHIPTVLICRYFQSCIVVMVPILLHWGLQWQVWH